MKLLENSSFEALSSRLCVEMGESRILGRWVSSKHSTPAIVWCIKVWVCHLAEETDH